MKKQTAKKTPPPFELTPERIELLKAMRENKDVVLDEEMFFLLNQDITPEREHPEIQDQMIRILLGIETINLTIEPVRQQQKSLSQRLKEFIRNTWKTKEAFIPYKPLLVGIGGIIGGVFLIFVVIGGFRNKSLKSRVLSLEEETAQLNDQISVLKKQPMDTIQSYLSINQRFKKLTKTENWIDSLFVKHDTKLASLYPLKTKHLDRVIVDSVVVRSIPNFLIGNQFLSDYKSNLLFPYKTAFESQKDTFDYPFEIVSSQSDQYYIGPINLNIYKVEKNGERIIKIPILRFTAYTDCGIVKLNLVIESEIEKVVKDMSLRRQTFTKSGNYIMELSVVDSTLAKPKSFINMFKTGKLDPKRTNYLFLTNALGRGNLNEIGSDQSFHIPWKRVEGALHFEIVEKQALLAYIKGR